MLPVRPYGWSFAGSSFLFLMLTLLVGCQRPDVREQPGCCEHDEQAKRVENPFPGSEDLDHELSAAMEACTSPSQWREGRCVEDRIMGVSRSVSYQNPSIKHHCALWDSGRVSCWGENNFGQLGDGTTTDRAHPVWVRDVEDAVQLQVGRDQTCALLSKGEIMCWGLLLHEPNGSQLGELLYLTPRTPPHLKGMDISHLASPFYDKICVFELGGDVHCLGGLGGKFKTYTARNFKRTLRQVHARYRYDRMLRFSSLRPDAVRPGFEPTQPTGDGSAPYVANTDWTLDASGALVWPVRWTFRRLLRTSRPQRVPIMDTVQRWQGGVLRSSCTIDRDGTATVWNGWLANVDVMKMLQRQVPIALPFEDVNQCVVANGYVCVLMHDGHVTCIGESVERIDLKNTPLWGPPHEDFPEVSGVRAIAAANNSLCLVDGDGGARCMGYSGRATRISGADPSTNLGPFKLVEPVLLGDVLDVVSAHHHSCALRRDGAVVCWGALDGGAVGVIQELDSCPPPRVTSRMEVLDWDPCNAGGSSAMVIGASAEDPVVEVGTGAGMSCARRRGGTVSCWGSWGGEGYHNSRSGVFSGGSRTSQAIEGVSDAIDLCVGSMGCVLTANGEVKCWGSNNEGQLGSGTRIPRDVAEPVEGLPRIERLLCDDKAVCAYDEASRAWCWGRLLPAWLGLKPPLTADGQAAETYVLDAPVDPPERPADLEAALRHHPDLR